eukprot:Em0001g2533a
MYKEIQLDCDPFDMNEADPSKTRALESCLWVVPEIGEPSEKKVEEDLGQYLDVDDDDLVQEECTELEGLEESTNGVRKSQRDFGGIPAETGSDQTKTSAMAQYKGAASEGARAMNLMKKREQQRQELEKMKQKIAEVRSLTGEVRIQFFQNFLHTQEHAIKSNFEVTNKFATSFDMVEEQLKSSTVAILGTPVLCRVSCLTSCIQEEEDDQEPHLWTPHSFRTRIGRSLLQEAEQKEREHLRQEWLEKQEKIKNEDIDITYSYWDGSGHRKHVQMKKGDSIRQFLQKCLESLRKDFSELSFDVHEDVRIINDASLEKDESHAGKVCLRSWYERNKHIFPASRWEPYDPAKNWEKYTIADKDKD